MDLDRKIIELGTKVENLGIYLGKTAENASEVALAMSKLAKVVADIEFNITELYSKIAALEYKLTRHIETPTGEGHTR